MIRAFLTPAEISEGHITLWSAMADWLFSNAEWARNGREKHLDHDFTSAAFTLLFCVAPDFSLICGIDPGWPHLNKFLPIIKRAICEFGVNETLYLGPSGGGARNWPRNSVGRARTGSRRSRAIFASRTAPA